MTLGEHLMILRKKKGISQGELGKLIGTSGDIIGRYERNVITPSIEVIIKVADALEISIDYLVGKTDFELDNTVLQRMIDIQKLNDREKECILFALDAMLRDAKTRKAYTK
jgi:transcriptional regulator with XRE-family HTH domain